MTTPTQSRTKSTYTLQWNRYRIVRPDEDRATLRLRTGWDLATLQGLRLLDAGCGMGRYLKVAGEAGAVALGLDLSEAVLAARDQTRDLPNVQVIRGDLLRLPLAEAAFDRIYSIGVLDHTPDPRRAFLGLARRLRPGGKIAIWVYQKERPALEAVMKAHRAVSTRLPLSLLVFMSQLLAPVGALKRQMMASPWRLIRRSGVGLNLLTIGVSMHPDPEVRVCDTLDWYAPRYASHHTLDEVRGWFIEAGLVDITDLSAEGAFFHAGQGNGINVSGKRP